MKHKLVGSNRDSKGISKTRRSSNEVNEKVLKQVNKRSEKNDTSSLSLTTINEDSGESGRKKTSLKYGKVVQLKNKRNERNSDSSTNFSNNAKRNSLEVRSRNKLKKKGILNKRGKSVGGNVEETELEIDHINKLYSTSDSKMVSISSEKGDL